MDRHVERERMRQGLRQIIALLFLFAALAERAGRLPHPGRVALISILHRAEAIALPFVSGQANDELPTCAHDDLAEAARLASGFRALAIMLTSVVSIFLGVAEAETPVGRALAAPPPEIVRIAASTAAASQRAPPAVRAVGAA